MKKLYLWTAAAVALTLTSCTSANTAGGGNGAITIVQPDNHVITVTSREEVKVTPDIADITYGVYTQAEDPVLCQNQNTDDVNKVVEVLKTSNVAESSIQTSGYGLEPIYDWVDNRRITNGYEMTTTITVSGIPIDQVGSLISDSISAGINSVQSVSYKSSKYDESYQEALKLAIENAKTKAEALAAAGGCTLDGIADIQELGNNQEARYSHNQYSADQAAGKAVREAAAAVMPGEVGVEAAVTVQFKIK